MAKLENPYVVVQRTFDPPEIQLIDAMREAGIDPPSTVHLDGKMHRFKNGKGHDKPGWYIAYADGVPAGRFGCWRSGVDLSWRCETDHRLTAQEEIAHARRMAEIKIMRDADAEARHELASEVVARIWHDAPEATADHPYLKRKGVQPHGARLTGDGRLIVPLFGDAGELSSLQYIDDDGGKLYHAGGATAGKSWDVGAHVDGPIYIAEGFATAATIHEVTGKLCVASYSASNLVNVIESVRALYPDADVVVVADHDKSGVGQRYAEQAVAKHGGRYVIPPTPGDANDYVQAGKDLASLLAPDAVGDWLIPADDFASQPSPIAWLVRGWIQSDALIMVHGPSGHGKTFVVLDWCLHMASDKAQWMGCTVKPGPVVYLAGEGHHGLRGRVAAWKVQHTSEKLNMWLSRDGCDLNTPQGLKRVIDNVRAIRSAPSLIVVDTLHRFLNGDENSAQDAKGMLDSCAALMSEFRCSVLLVHHTGVSDEAQGRARGSSAWRGALDIEVSVTTKDSTITIAQKKSKDAEMLPPIFGQLASVTIPGWMDEDGAPVTSAVLAAADAPPVREKESPGAKHRKAWENAWWSSGAEVLDGDPYLTRSALRQYLEADGWKASTIDQGLKPSARPGSMVRDLIDCKFLAPKAHGWIVADPVRASGLVLGKGPKVTA
jgi:phage/plasmid primase-like uncharacterized protein